MLLDYLTQDSSFKSVEAEFLTVKTRIAMEYYKAQALLCKNLISHKFRIMKEFKEDFDTGPQDQIIKQDRPQGPHNVSPHYVS